MIQTTHSPHAECRPFSKCDQLHEHEFTLIQPPARLSGVGPGRGVGPPSLIPGWSQQPNPEQHDASHQHRATRQKQSPLSTPWRRRTAGERTPNMDSDDRGDPSPWSRESAGFSSGGAAAGNRSVGIQQPNSERTFRPSSPWFRPSSGVTSRTPAGPGATPGPTDSRTGSGETTSAARRTSDGQRITSQIASCNDWYQIRASIAMNKEQLNTVHVTAALSRLATIAVYPKQVGFRSVVREW